MAKVNKRNASTQKQDFTFIFEATAASSHTVISVLCDAIIKKDVINKSRVLLATSINIQITLLLTGTARVSQSVGRRSFYFPARILKNS